MKAELTLPPEFVREIASEVIRAINPLLKGKGEDDTIFTPETLAEYLKVDTSWVYKSVSSKKIPFFKSGKYVRFKKSSIDQWISSQENLTTHLKRYIG